ncbi:MAG: response regulator [Candidatus Promineifilaceae bacterium]
MTKRVLIVDDHAETLEYLHTLLELERDRPQVSVAASAEAGLAALRLETFDLLITDLKLPGMDGLELVRRIRPEQPGLPVILVSAYASPREQMAANELAIRHFFRKPISSEQFMNAVRALLSEESRPRPAGETRALRSLPPERATEADSPTSQEESSSPEKLSMPEAPAATETSSFSPLPADGALAEDAPAEALAELPSGETRGFSPRPSERPAAAESASLSDKLALHDEISPPPAAPEAWLARLNQLRADAGARLALLATSRGQLAAQAGTVERLALDPLVASLAAGVRHTLEAAGLLAAREPFSIQFLLGKDVGLYVAAVDEEYFLVIAVDAQSARGMVGTVWLLAQRAISDFRRLIAGDGPGAASEVATVAPPSPNPPAGASEPAAEPARYGPTLDEAAGEGPVEQRPDDAFAPSPETQKQTGEMDAFWESALIEELHNLEAPGPRIGLDEARRKGLIPDEFDPD